MINRLDRETVFSQVCLAIIIESTKNATAPLREEYVASIVKTAVDTGNQVASEYDKLAAKHEVLQYLEEMCPPEKSAI